MPFYQWDPSLLSVYVGEMDREHQELIAKMNAVFDANQAKAGREQLGVLLRDFAAYTAKHFSDEEAHMAKVGYEGLVTHRIIHKQLLDQVAAHMQAFEKTGTLTDSFFHFLSVWLTSHIRGIDRKYGEKKAS